MTCNKPTVFKNVRENKISSLIHVYYSIMDVRFLRILRFSKFMWKGPKKKVTDIVKCLCYGISHF